MSLLSARSHQDRRSSQEGILKRVALIIAPEDDGHAKAVAATIDSYGIVGTFHKKMATI